MTTATKTAPAPEPATSSSQTALDLFLERVEKSGSRVALKSKVKGVWRPRTWNDCDTDTRRIAAGLVSLGVAVGDRVVILANTREEWFVSDVGILRAGAVTVPIYPSNLPDQCEYIINDCGAKVCIVEDPHQLEKLLDPEVKGNLGGVEKIILMSDTAHLERPDAKGRKTVTLDEVAAQGSDDRARVLMFDDLKKLGDEFEEKNPEKMPEIARSIDPEQAATIVYTSGTTGPPKGVVLAHRSLVFECGAISSVVHFTEEDEQVLFLPMAHIFAKILAWGSIYSGAITTFAESVPKLIENLAEVRPTFMGAVPRVYEKAYAKVQGRFEDKRKSPVGKLIVDWALKKGKQRSDIERAGGSADGFGVRLADRLVFEKVRSTFGGRLRFFVSGGAPLAREIAEFFHSAGILILEGYGLTETTAATHCNTPEAYRFGTVGRAIPGVECKIAEDGEILMRGPNILKEYYGKPEATAEAIDKDGWFHSGDIGVIEDGFLRITDRKKDIIVTAGGKNVAPQNIENSFKALCPIASQMMVYGDKRKYLSALITLNPEMIEPWARDRGISFSSYEDLTQKPEVLSAIQEYVNKLNADLASYETIKKFKILDSDFTQETGELTPTLKVKRKFCSEKYREILEGFYAE